MSSIEQQLVRDIALVKESVVLTESELLNARNAIAERADTQRGRNRQRAALAVAAAAAAAIVGVGLIQNVGTDDQTTPPVGPKPTVSDPYEKFLRGELPTPGLIDGFWRVDNGGLSVLFRDNGTVQLDDSGRLFSHPQLAGSYAIDGSLITLTWDDGATCDETSLPIRASIPKPGSMHIVQTPPSECSPFGAGQTVMEQVLPTSRGLANMVFADASGWKPLSEATALDGDWLAEGGGFVLEMDPDGDYVVLDTSAEPVDGGRWSLRGSDLRLTSSSSSAECAEGDVLSWGAVEQLDVGTTLIRGAVEQNTCGGKWTPKAWILIPHNGS